MDFLLLDRLYLCIYNGVQCILWFVIFFLSLSRWSSVDGYAVLRGFVRVAQRLALLEAVHPVVGLSHGSFLPALVQLLGRNLCLFYAIARYTSAQAVALELILVWAAIEIIRFPYYIATVLGVVDAMPFLSWLRYSVFIPLYPIGMILELRCWEAANQMMKSDLLPGEHLIIALFETQFFRVSMDVPRLVSSLKYIYLIVGPMQYVYMLQQRAKKI